MAIEYATGTAGNWQALATAMSGFATTTLGTYTEEFGFVGAQAGSTQAGLTGHPAASGAGARTVMCLKHNTSSMYFMWDSGPATTAGTGVAPWYANAGEFFIQGIMCEPDEGTTAPSNATAFGSHPGIPHVDVIPENGMNLTQYQPPTANSIIFGGSPTYYLFGGDGLNGDPDYFHMVLEIQEGVYSHFWSGQIDPTTSLLPGSGNRFGGFLGITGPQSYSSTVQSYNYCFDSNDTIGNAAGYVFFPEYGGYDPPNYPNILPEASTIDLRVPPENLTVLKEHVIGSITPDLKLNWARFGTGPGAFNDGYKPSFGQNFTTAGYSNITGRTFIGPHLAHIGNPQSVDGAHMTDVEWANGARIAVTGSYPGVNPISLEALEATNEITVSTDKYKVFPTLRKNIGPDDEIFPKIWSQATYTSGNWSTDTGNRNTIATGCGTGYEGLAYLIPVS